MSINGMTIKKEGELGLLHICWKVLTGKWRMPRIMTILKKKKKNYDQNSPVSVWSQAKNFYTQSAALLLTTTLILVLLNLVTLYLLSRPTSSNPVVERYGERIYDAYPDMNRSQIDHLLNSFWLGWWKQYLLLQSIC